MGRSETERDAAADRPAAPLLAGLLPGGVAISELMGSPAVTPLLPDEVLAVSGALPIRVEEFARGRHCARAALAQLGIHQVAVGSNPDRSPQWPGMVVGSITHTAGYCAAAVGSRRRFAGIGIDAERVAALGPEIHDQICTAAELAWLTRLAPATANRMASLLFSAKEAFYKAQYPIVGAWLDFTDIRLDPTAAEAAIGHFSIHPCRPLSIAQSFAPPWHGSFRFSAGYVLTAIAFELSEAGVVAGTVAPVSRPGER